MPEIFSGTAGSTGISFRPVLLALASSKGVNGAMGTTAEALSLFDSLSCAVFDSSSGGKSIASLLGEEGSCADFAGGGKRSSKLSGFPAGVGAGGIIWSPTIGVGAGDNGIC
jgi:hypothetical protein